MLKRLNIVFAMIMLAILLVGCTVDQSAPDIEETIQNGGAYKEEVSKEVSADTSDEETGDVSAELNDDTEVNEDNEIDTEVNNDSDKVTKDNNELQSDKVQSLKILSTHEIEAETINFDEDMQLIIDSVHERGGYISSVNITSKDLRGEKMMDSELTLRVPKDKANEVIDIIHENVAVIGETLTSVDATDEYYDIEARIKNLENREKRLRELYENSDNISEIIEIDDKLFEVTEEKEKVIQQKIKMQDRIVFSRVDLKLKEVNNLSIVRDEEKNLSASEKIANSFTSTIDFVKDAFVGIIVSLIRVAPVLILIATGVYVYRNVVSSDKVKVITKETEEPKETHEKQEIQKDDKQGNNKLKDD